MSIRSRPRSVAHSAANPITSAKGLHGHQIRHSQHLSPHPVRAGDLLRARWRPTCASGPTSASSRAVDAYRPRCSLVVLPAGARRSRTRSRAAARCPEPLDVVLVQHEYGIFGGADGDDVLDVLRALQVPLDHRAAHRPRPTRRPHQREILEGVVAPRRRGDDDRDGPPATGRRLGRRPRSGRRHRRTAPGRRVRVRHGHAPRGRQPTSSPGGCSGRARASSGRSRRWPACGDLRPAADVPGRRRDPPQGPRARRRGLPGRPGRAGARARPRPTGGSSTPGTSTSRAAAHSSRAADVVLLPYDSARPGDLGRAHRGRRRRQARGLHRLPARRRAALRRRRPPRPHQRS